MNLSKSTWFTEFCSQQGSAISYQIKQCLYDEKSDFQRVRIFETTHHGKLMVLDDYIMLTSRDNFLYHEMISHPALFTHAAPKNIAIIGGGDCGTLQEVLKHTGPEKVTQIEIDEQVTRVSEVYFPELCTSNDDPRVSLVFEDGIKWMQQAKPSSLDIIIIDSADPIGPGEGLFQMPFYQSCFQALKPGGIMAQQSDSPLYSHDLIQSMHHAYHQVGFTSSHTLSFPQPCYPSGWWSATLVGKGVDVKRFRQQEASQKSFATRYYNADIHQASLATVEFMK